MYTKFFCMIRTFCKQFISDWDNRVESVFRFLSCSLLNEDELSEYWDSEQLSLYAYHPHIDIQKMVDLMRITTSTFRTSSFILKDL